MIVKEFKPQEVSTRSNILHTDINIITRDKKAATFAFNSSGRAKLRKMINKYNYFEIEYVSETELILYLKKDKTGKTYGFIKNEYCVCQVKLFSTSKYPDPVQNARNENLNKSLKSLLDTGCTSIPYNISKIVGNVVYLIRDSSLPFNIFVTNPLLPATGEFINNFIYVTTCTV
jgi:hypothetical protein